MSCRGKAAAAIVKERKMPRISNAFLIAALSLVPAALAGPASAFVQLAETQDSAATASVQHDAASPSQGHIKEIFFDAARAGRDDLLDGLMKTVDFLIQKGANPCATDTRGNSSLMGVAFKGEIVIAHRLIAAHCDVNARNDAGQTALMMAAMFGQTDVVKMLLANGAKPELQDRVGNTAMTLAQQQANPQMVALLTQAVKGQ